MANEEEYKIDEEQRGCAMWAVDLLRKRVRRLLRWWASSYRL